MKANIEYKIYEIDESHLKERDSMKYDKENRVCLIEKRFSGWQHNSFDSFETALQYLIDNTLTYTDYTILPVIRIND